MIKFSNSRNPILPMEYHFPDCEAHVMSDGKLYLYGSFDERNDKFCSERYYVISTDDLQNWDIGDVSFKASQVDWAKIGGSKHNSSLGNVKTFDDLPEHIRLLMPKEARNTPIEQIISAIQEQSRNGLSEEIMLYAPDAIEKDGKYYLYFCMSDDSEGVAVSDSPDGPFGCARKINAEGIDPAIFVDDDGVAYYYWGQFSATGARLNLDMFSIDERTLVKNILTEKQHHFHEGSSVRKRGDTYYYVFADISRGKPTSLGYATSKSPLGTYEYQGIIIDNSNCDPKAWNNHGSIEQFNGQWYVFYHRSSQNSQFMRRVCAEPIFFTDKGLIEEVKMTSQGIGEPFKTGEHIPTYTACEVSGNAYIAPHENSESIYFMSEGDSAVFRYVKNTEPITEMQFELSGNGQIEVYFGDVFAGVSKEGCDKISLNIPVGVHEIIIRLSHGDNCVLQSFVLI